MNLDDITGINRDEWQNDIDTALADDYPQPDFWRMLVMPVRPPKKSKGGIEIPTMTQDAAAYLNYIGKVVALGPLAYQSERFRLGDGTPIPAPKPGDFVIYGRYAGQPLEHRGVKLLLVNDDEVLARVTDPDSLRVYI